MSGAAAADGDRDCEEATTMEVSSGSIFRFSLQRNEAQRSATRESVTTGSALTGAYLAMNAVATIMAGLGLLENSTAVIIGAMLIAMLFGPIVGIALGLAEGDLSLVSRSFLSEIAGAAWVLAIGFMVGLASRNLSMGAEILSRTSPNLLDLLVGLAGGIAGGFTYVSPGLSGVVVGVAISTALVPPLTTCGILLAHRLPGLAAGAFLLFLANFTAIAIGAMLIFWLAGHRPRMAGQSHRILVPRLISLLILVVLGGYFTNTFRRTAAQSALEYGIRKTVSTEVARIPGARLVNVTIEPSQGRTTAWVVVRTPQPVSPEQVARLNDVVDRAAKSAILLRVRSVITTETTRDGYVYQAQPMPGEVSEP
jgi:uncharacterized hydrophobic protein (TIGR00271 family)